MLEIFITQYYKDASVERMLLWFHVTTANSLNQHKKRDERIISKMGFAIVGNGKFMCFVQLQVVSLDYLLLPALLTQGKILLPKTFSVNNNSL